MPARLFALVAAGVAVSLCAGCTVVAPPGWGQRRTLPVMKIWAKPLVMYGVAPHRWVSPLGEVVVEHAGALTVVGPLTSGTSFSVRFHGAKEPGLNCQIYVEPAGAFASHAHTHGALFGCVSDRREVVFFAGRGCRYPVDITRPSCHQGELRVGQQHVGVGWGSLQELRAPVGYISYNGSQGELLGAANIVGQQAIDLWMRPASSAAERRRQRSLVLLTVALHQFRHFTAS